MGFSLPVLMSAEQLSPAYRWRLVDGFFAGIRTSVEGCGALAIVAAAGLIRFGGAGFEAALFLSLVILAGRVASCLDYQRRRSADAPPQEVGAHALPQEVGAHALPREVGTHALLREIGAHAPPREVGTHALPREVGTRALPRDTPDFWAGQFMIASLACAAMWAVLNVSALETGSATMQLFVLTVQSGWLGAACARNAASPATVMWQAVLVLVPAELTMILSHNHFIHLLILFAPIQFSSTVSIARAIGRQLEAALMSEQALAVANARLTELSATDGLTGIANRRAFDTALTVEWARAARDSTDLGLLIIDVDYFKAFNDCYGHLAGDDCLRLVAEVTERTLRRPPDTAARYGGEEFVALLPCTSLEGALAVAERVRAAIADAGLAHQGSGFNCVTVSVGVSSMAPHHGMDPQALIDLADRALYEAKNAGRNLVRCGMPALGGWESLVRP